MACSQLARAKRALVTLLLSFARVYGIAVQVCRDSPDADVQRAYRRVLLKVHPDKGGAVGDAQRLHAARDTWQEARP